jgi:hypothetical protein
MPTLAARLTKLETQTRAAKGKRVFLWVGPPVGSDDTPWYVEAGGNRHDEVRYGDADIAALERRGVACTTVRMAYAECGPAGMRGGKSAGYGYAARAASARFAGAREDAGADSRNTRAEDTHSLQEPGATSRQV